MEGLNHIEEIAGQGLTDLRIDVEAADGAKAFETFDGFSLSPGPAFTLHLGSTIASHNSKYLTIFFTDSINLSLPLIPLSFSKTFSFVLVVN